MTASRATAFLLAFVGGVLTALGLAALLLGRPVDWDSRDVFVLAVALAGIALAALGVRELNGVAKRTM